MYGTGGGNGSGARDAGMSTKGGVVLVRVWQPHVRVVYSISESDAGSEISIAVLAYYEFSVHLAALVSGAHQKKAADSTLHSTLPGRLFTALLLIRKTDSLLANLTYVESPRVSGGAAITFPIPTPDMWDSLFASRHVDLILPPDSWELRLSLPSSTEMDYQDRSEDHDGELLGRERDHDRQRDNDLSVSESFDLSDLRTASKSRPVRPGHGVGSSGKVGGRNSSGGTLGGSGSGLGGGASGQTHLFSYRGARFQLESFLAEWSSENVQSMLEEVVYIRNLSSHGSSSGKAGKAHQRSFCFIPLSHADVSGFVHLRIYYVNVDSSVRYSI